MLKRQRKLPADRAITLEVERAVGRFLTFLVTEKNATPNTISAYRNDLSLFIDFLANAAATTRPIALQSIRQSQILLFLAELQTRQNAPATISRRLAALKSFFAYLSAERIIASDPAEDINQLRWQRRRPKSLSVAQVELLLRQPEQHTTVFGYRDKAMVAMLYATGLRVSELIGLTISDIVLHDGTIFVRSSGRNCVERMLPLNDMAIEALLGYLRESRSKLVKKQDEQTLFLNNHGNQISRQGIWTIFKRYAALANLPASVSAHTLRASFAVHLLQKGVPAEQVMTLLGHQRLGATKWYMPLRETEREQNGVAESSFADKSNTISLTK